MEPVPGQIIDGACGTTNDREDVNEVVEATAVDRVSLDNELYRTWSPTMLVKVINHVSNSRRKHGFVKGFDVGVKFRKDQSVFRHLEFHFFDRCDSAF
jgi:hypothetical protein